MYSFNLTILKFNLVVFYILILSSVSFHICLGHVNNQNINKFIGENDNGKSVFPEVDNMKMHIRCYQNPNINKQSKPTVLLHTGVPFPSMIFANLLQTLVPHLPFMNVGKVCVFDRYGYGYSDPSPKELLSEDVAFYLHESLHEANITGPYILAGWSWGAVDMQFFALKYMKEVVGILSIDGTDSGLYTDLEFPIKQEKATVFLNFLLTKLKDGSLKNFTQTAQLPISSGYVPSESELYKPAADKINEFFGSDNFITTFLQEIRIMIPSVKMLADKYSTHFTTNTIVPPLSNIPFIVLTAVSDDTTADWIKRQTVMASLSSVNEQINTTSSHFMPIEEPLAIVKALKTLVSKYVDLNIPIKSIS